MDYLRDDWFQFFGVLNVLRLDPAAAFFVAGKSKKCVMIMVYLDLIPGEAIWQ